MKVKKESRKATQIYYSNFVVFCFISEWLLFRQEWLSQKLKFLSISTIFFVRGMLVEQLRLGSLIGSVERFDPKSNGGINIFTLTLKEILLVYSFILRGLQLVYVTSQIFQCAYKGQPSTCFKNSLESSRILKIEYRSNSSFYLSLF